MPIHTEQLGLMLIISDVIGQSKAFPNNSCVSRTELKSFPKCILFPRESRLLSHEFMILFIFPRSFTKIVCHFSHSISSEISVFFFFFLQPILENIHRSTFYLPPCLEILTCYIVLPIFKPYLN